MSQNNIITVYGNLGSDPKLLESHAKTATTKTVDPVTNQVVENTRDLPNKHFYAYSIAVTRKDANGDPVTAWIEVLDFKLRSQDFLRGDRVKIRGTYRARTYAFKGETRTKHQLILVDAFLERHAGEPRNPTTDADATDDQVAAA